MNPYLRPGRYARYAKVILLVAAMVFCFSLILLAIDTSIDLLILFFHIVLLIPPCMLFAACGLLLIGGPGTLVRVLAGIPIVLFLAVAGHGVVWSLTSGLKPQYVVACYLACVVGWFPAYYAARTAEDEALTPADLEGYCVNCGYDLTGNVTGVCPECGHRFRPPSQWPPRVS